MIKHQRLLELVRYNEQTGLFISKETNTIADTGLEGFKRVVVDDESYTSHKLAWFYCYEEWRDDVLHINKNKGDNSIANLRLFPTFDGRIE